MAISSELVDTVAIIRAVQRSFPQPERVVQLLESRDPSAVLAELYEDGLFNPELDQARADANSDITEWIAEGYSITSILDSSYPVRLASVREAPALIFSEGRLDHNDVGVSVVGSRTATPNQLQAAKDTAAALVARGLTVVSGLAAGIDAAAHQSALDHGGRTVAVMGTGLHHTYPAGHRALRHQIERSGGLVMSQFFPDFKGAPYSFPMRNAVMSGYGVATVVIAATEKSGTRHQARAAQGHGRALILTPPVAEGTTWGRELSNMHNVYVARSSAEVADLAGQLADRRDAGAHLFA